MSQSIRYNSAADLAALFGVKPGTIETWRVRYDDFPPPDAYVGGYAGWLPSREIELRAWEANRPGRGAGGGRPRKDSPAEPVSPPRRTRKPREDTAPAVTFTAPLDSPNARIALGADPDCPHPKRRIQKGLCGACGTYVGTTTGGKR